MSKSYLRGIRNVAIALLMTWAMTANSSTTKIWMIASTADFARGKLENVTILSSGQLARGMGAERSVLEEISIWAITFGPDGTPYIGTGNKGLVYKLTKDGFEKVFDTGEGVVTCLEWVGDTLYAGTIPNGRVFSWKEGGKLEKLAELDVPYIWDMIHDPDSGKLMLGTGPGGKIITVSPKGETKVFHDSNESHILSLVRAPDGTVYAGTSMRGVVFEFSPEGKVKRTWDLDENEIRGLCYRDGSLYIAANKISAYEADIYFMEERGMLQDRSHFAALLASRISQLQQGDEAIEKSFQELFDAAIYRLTPEKTMHQILKIENRYVCDLGVDKDNTIYAATADEGELWAATEPNLGWVMMDFKEAQVLSIGMQNDELKMVGTANAAAIYRTGPEAAENYQFTSEVKDTGFRSAWGSVEWKSTGAIELMTRTGNQSIPDATWSEWSKPLSKSGENVKSPRGRFIQFRLRWKKKSDSKIDWVRLAYVNENQRPQVGRVITASLHDVVPGTLGSLSDDQDRSPYGFSSSSDDDMAKVRIQWTASDPDGDRLLYWLYYKKEGDDDWVIINPKEPIRESSGNYSLDFAARQKANDGRRMRGYPYGYQGYGEDWTQYDWKTGNLADGWYAVKVVASDERDNAKNAKKVWKEVGPVQIDNRKPEINELKTTGRLTWEGSAKDSMGHIARVEYNLDGEKWEILSPKDGIYDKKQEEFKISFKDVSLGEHVLTVRAFDECGNIGMRQVGFTEKPDSE